MSDELKTSRKRKKTKSKLIVRLMLPMILLIMLQLVTFFAILIVSGEFNYVEQYAYDTLIEKTENRKNYIESQMQQKMPFVIEAADKMNTQIAEILRTRHASISDIQTDKDLNRYIMESSVDSLVELMRRSTVNDVFIILDTGDLYSEADGHSNAKAALYLRDLDTMTDSGYEDMLMEVGFSSISQEYGIVFDSGWTLHFNPDPDDMSNYDFYYKTIDTAVKNPNLSLKDLGYWSGFSKLTRGASAASMKYSVPLIADDGTVYGIIGIGMTENNVLANLPANDFISETACYIIGCDQDSSGFQMLTHSGIVFNRFFVSEQTLKVGSMLEENIYDFTIESSTPLAGSVQYINLYTEDSPYYSEEWALISVADKGSVLRPLTILVHLLIIAAVISLIFTIFFAIFSSREVVKPISSAIDTMNTNREYSQVIRFKPSNIYEIDKMTDAITQLQINVRDFSSQVSQMIRIVDVGIGTFMYDRTDDSIYAGQSLLKLLTHQVHEEDKVLSRQDFIDSIVEDETRQVIAESLKLVPHETQTDYSREYSIPKEDGNVIWMRLSLVYNKNKSIGILQDITNAMLEKKRIEYERDYDNITGLLNRHAYYRQIESLFQDTDALKTTAFIMLDLDNLKYVNDTYGHDFGDDYIRTAATALKQFQKYGGIVSRLSGDEFNICLSGFSSKDEVRKVIEEVRNEMLQTYCLLADGTHFKVRASAGVSWYPDDSTSYEMLMKYADFAMYTIKHSTKGEIAEFDMATYAKDSVLITGVEEMNRIIDECSVRYAFQSIVSAKTGEIYGYEALMRPQSTMFQSPLDLLRIAKTGAKLYEIERLTWTKALADFREQIDAGNVGKGSRIFINSVSNCVLEAVDVDALEKIYPDLLSQVVLEILETENVNEEYNMRKVKRMKKWNAQIALDDFGTGYNSEYALITMQPNIIKIDRSIISGCDKDVSRRTIINNLVKLAQTKQILVLAEGVETEEEMKTVISCGVDLLQGFYLKRPLFEPQPIEPELAEKIKHSASLRDM